MIKEWMLLKRITFDQTIADPINRMILLSKLASTYVMYDRVNWTNLGLVNIDVSNSFEGEIGVVRKSRGGGGPLFLGFIAFL
jgi:hypothetical protein